VCRDEDALVALDSADRDALERIQFELILAIRLFWGNVLGDRDIVVPWGNCNLMPNLCRYECHSNKSDGFAHLMPQFKP